jgi:hypothetical protein
MTNSTSHSMQHSAVPHEPDPNFIKWLKENCVPIAGTTFGALVLCLIVHYSSTTVDWARIKDFADAIANLTQTIALIAAGVWAYFKFAKGRTFQDRLTARVTGEFVSIGESVFLVVMTELHNVGLSRIEFDPDASLLIVFDCLPTVADEIVSVRNQRLTSFLVFGEKDRYIEPNELVERQCLIALPQVSNIGYQVEVEIVTVSGHCWRATAIVHGFAFEDNEVAQSTRNGDERL